MTCMSLTSAELGLLAEWLAAIAVCMAFLGAVFGWMATKALDRVGEWLRKRGARAPFVERAEAFERRAQRWASAFERIAARNRREAIRRGDWADEG